MTNPLISIIFIYHPYNPRITRVIEYFFYMSLTFFFQLIPFYFTDNPELIKMINNRSLEDRYKKLKNLEVTTAQVI
jgi:hypothetical protein